jgi:ABC-2 type transport system permease protein
MALVIPRGHAADLAAGRTARVQVIADATDSTTASLALGYAQSIVRAHSRNVVLRAIERERGTRPAGLLDVRPRVWFNPELESRNFLVPALIPVIMMVIAALLTSLTISREWENGTMEQLISTPVRGSELIVGKLAPYLALAFFDLVATMLTAQYLFGVPLRGSALLVLALAAVYLVGVLSLGVLISLTTRTQLLASQTALIATFLPSYMLSGFIFNIRDMPAPIRLLTYLVPARYFVTIIRGIYLKGIGVAMMAADTLLLAAFACVTLTVAIVLFRKRLA